MQIYEKTASFPIKTEGKMHGCPQSSNKTFLHDFGYRCQTNTRNDRSVNLFFLKNPDILVSPFDLDLESKSVSWRNYHDFYEKAP